MCYFRMYVSMLRTLRVVRAYLNQKHIIIPILPPMAILCFLFSCYANAEKNEQMVLSFGV